VIAAEIVADLEAALEQFRLIAEDLAPDAPESNEGATISASSEGAHRASVD
jgi:hypothetical protein